MTSVHKHEEKRWGDRFAEVWDGRSQLKKFAQDDAPDFRGELSDGRRFGLEIAKLTDNAVAEGQFLIRGRFEPELKQMSVAASVYALFSVGFEPYDVARLKDPEHRKRLIDGMVRFAQEAGKAQRSLRRRKLEARGIDGLDHLDVYPEENDVGLMVGRHTPGRTWNFVQERIAEKDAKVGHYRRRIGDSAELWLLLIASESFASGVELPPLHLKYDTAFDRLFFLDHWPERSGKGTDRIIELPIRERLAAS